MRNKFILLVLSLLMVFTLVSCDSKEEVISDEPIVIEGEMEGGSFTDVEDGTITDELRALFEGAQASWNGIPMEPIKLLQTQVVAGTNYKFLAKETINSTDGPVVTYKEVIIYEDLEGNLLITSVEQYEGGVE